MSALVFIAALQTSGTPSPSSNPPGAVYFELGLVVAVLVVMVVVFVRAGARRGPKH
jgi:hypothetical protein